MLLKMTFDGPDMAKECRKYIQVEMTRVWGERRDTVIKLLDRDLNPP